MFKIIAFLTRKTGTTLEAMKAHYENTHIPLALKTFPQIIEHRRNYVDQGSAIFGPEAPRCGYDAISEIWFADREGFDGMLAILTDAQASRAIREDEQSFLDTDRCGMMFVDEEVARGTGALLSPGD